MRKQPESQDNKEQEPGQDNFYEIEKEPSKR